MKLMLEGFQELTQDEMYDWMGGYGTSSSYDDDSGYGGTTGSDPDSYNEPSMPPPTYEEPSGPDPEEPEYPPFEDPSRPGVDGANPNDSRVRDYYEDEHDADRLSQDEADYWTDQMDLRVKTGSRWIESSVGVATGAGSNQIHWDGTYWELYDSEGNGPTMVLVDTNNDGTVDYRLRTNL